MDGYKVEIIPNNDEADVHEGLRILGKIVARKFLAEHNIVITDETIEEGERVEQHI